MYVDESGCTDLRSGRLFVLSGVIIQESFLDDIKTRMLSFKQENFIDDYKDAEIHVHHIWQGKRPFHRISQQTKISLLEKLYSFLYDLPMTLISIIIDKESMLSGKYVNWSIFKASWTFLTERFDMFITDNGGTDKGLIIIDMQTKGVNEEIRKQINDLRLNGSEHHNFEHIFEEPLFVPSFNRDGLQIADAVYFCTLKHFCNNYNFNYWNCIESKYRRSNHNRIYGYGVKLFP